jgi:hypothetical protein
VQYNRRSGLEGDLIRKKISKSKARFGARASGNQSASDALNSLRPKPASSSLWCPCQIRVKGPPAVSSKSWSDAGLAASDEHSSESTSYKPANPTPESPGRFKTTS